MAYTDLTLKKLFVLSGNVCAFPRCPAPIYDTEENVITGEICHIKGKRPNGPRYDFLQTKEQRNGYENLILMCSPHNKIVDDPVLQDKYTVEVLTGYKQKHEAQFKNSVVQPALLQRFVTRFRDLLPPPRPSLLRIAVSFLRRRPDRPEDEYGIRIRCSNRTEDSIDDLALELSVPKRYRLAAMEIPARVEGRSVLETPTRILLQVDSVPPGKYTSLRSFLSVPVDLYPIPKSDIVRMVLRFRRQHVETKEFSLKDLLVGSP
jgi:hypothetical protein